jgi:phosphoglycolate phosphatase
MAKQFELIVFDWDGTLMDSAAAIVEAIQAACRDLDLPPPTDAQARHVIGLGLADAMRHAVPHLSETAYPQMVERYRHHYLSRDHELKLFDGVASLIPELADAGHLLAVATGKSRLGLDRALKVSGLESLFHDSRCADECFSKPHPQMLEELMAVFSVEPEQTLMIGDTTHDLMMASNAGVASLAVTYGAHTLDALSTCSPLAQLHTVEELRQWLKANA